MSVALSVKDAGVGLALTRMTSLLRDMQPVYKAIGSKLESNVHLRFDTKTAPDGEPWQAWGPGTAKVRGAEGRGTLLEYTGRMRDSLTFLADASGVEVGFGVEYAQFHESGTGRLPRRAMLFDGDGLGDDDLNDALGAALRAFKKQLKLQATT